MKTPETEAHPIEHFHAKLLDHYHVWRKKKSRLGLLSLNNTSSLTFADGADFSNFIAEVKTEIYKQFPELDKKP